MKIAEEIKQNHRHLSVASQAFLEQAINNDALLKRDNYAPLKALDGIMSLQAWPTFIDGKRKGDHKCHKTKIQHGRVDHHARVAQEGVKAAPIRRVRRRTPRSSGTPLHGGASCRRS